MERVNDNNNSSIYAKEESKFNDTMSNFNNTMTMAGDNSTVNRMNKSEYTAMIN